MGTVTPQTKSNLQRSETWLSAIAAIGAVLTVNAHKDLSVFVAVGVTVALAAAFAIFRTPLVNKKRPGVKTKAFWTALVVVLGSVAAAVAEADIPGVPAKVVQVAGAIAAGVTALGYNIWRYKGKVAQ